MSLLLICPLIFFGQAGGGTSLKGIINQYSQVTSIDICNNRVVVNQPNLFTAGEKVLLIQMRGAEVNEQNTSNFGEIENYWDAGNYEILRVGSINSNVITFSTAIERSYDATGRLQLITFPSYTDANIDSTLTAGDWNGVTGGVLAFEVTGNLNFFADIDVSRKGFNGGGYYNYPLCYNGGVGGYGGYRCDSASACGGTKGEGIGNPTLTLGRGAPANGGGGGNDHNTGGGGGGNYGSGGQGGERKNASQFACPGPNPGIGGHSLAYSVTANKAFMGGGGGNGDQNNDEGTYGQEGGGIVLIRAGVIDGNNRSIIADGGAVLGVAWADGAGGGGAGGTVLLDVNTYNSAIDVRCNGGDGGDVNNGNDPNFCMGPGGGGAGGILWVNQATIPVNISFMAAGGDSGMTVNANAHPDCFQSSNGARSGQDGGTLTGLSIVESADTFIELTLTASPDTVICEGADVLLCASGTATGGPRFEWSDGQSGDCILVSPTSTTNYTVSVLDSRDCFITENVLITVIQGVTFNVEAIPDSIINLGESVLLQADPVSGATYLWQPPTGLDDPTSSTPKANPQGTTTYCVTVTNTDGCFSTECITIVVEAPYIAVPDAFSPNDDGLNDQIEVLYPPNLVVDDFLIFNRWGELVHSGSGPWDGNFNGQEQPIGTYVFYAKATSTDGSSTVVELQGSISLIR